MGNKQTNDDHQVTNGEQIMVDIYELTKNKVPDNNSNSETAPPPKSLSRNNSISSLERCGVHTPTLSETKHRLFDSKLSLGCDIEFALHSSTKSRRRSSSIAQKVSEIFKPNAKQIDEDISEQIEREELEEMYTLNILLLGSSQSGKNVIFKQMEKVFNDGKIEDKQIEYTLQCIHRNLIKDIIVLCDANNRLNNQHCHDDHKHDDNPYKLHHEQLQEICYRLSSMDKTTPNLSREIAMEMAVLWKSDAMQATFQRLKQKDILNENTRYFLDKIKTVIDSEYEVQFEDYLRIRDEREYNIGLSHSKYLLETEYGKYQFKVTQINQQKSCKKRWYPYLDNVNVIIYVMNLALYDQFYDTEKTQNCLQNALRRFNSLCKATTFNNGTDFVVFFNQSERFKEKLKTVPFSRFDPKCNDEYAADAELIKLYLMEEMMRMFAESRKQCGHSKRGHVYFHEGDEGDTEQMALLLQKVQTDVIASTMKKMGYVF